MTPSSVNKYVCILSNLYAFAVDREMCQPHHRPRIKPLREEREPRRYFTQDEIRTLFEVSAGMGPDVALFVRLGCLTGLRRQEILSLRQRDVDREHGLLLICDHRPMDDFRPKTSQERRVPVHKGLWPWLDQPCETGYYFPGVKTPWRREFKRPWDALMKLADIDPPAGTHAMRHSFGTMLARSGCSAWEIQALMGHAHARTSEVYIHMVGGRDLRRAVESIPLALSDVAYEPES